MACSCCIHASLHGGVNAPCQRGMPLPPGRSWSALIADNGAADSRNSSYEAYRHLIRCQLLYLDCFIQGTVSDKL